MSRIIQNTAQKMSRILRFAAQGSLECLKLDFARQNIRPHAPITGEAVKGVFEGGGAVVFEEEVANPCEGVAL
jgi:hypothetical protein